MSRPFLAHCSSRFGLSLRRLLNGFEFRPVSEAVPRTYRAAHYRGVEIVTDSARYIKIVEWSEEDGAFVGQCPGVIGPCCHGPNEAEVFRTNKRGRESFIDSRGGEW